MADIFSHTVTFGGAFSADSAKMTFAGSAAGLLASQIEYQYQQKISRVYELGGPRVFLVAGRTIGQVSVMHVIGPMNLAVDFYTTYGAVCNAGTNIISFSAVTGCSAGAVSQTISLEHAVIESISGRVQAEDMLMYESITMMYLSLSMSTPTP